MTNRERHEQATLIVGQGLAGTAVAWALHRRGERVEVIDPGSPAASHIAAGLVTPVAGKRFAVAPHYEVLFTRARSFYQNIEQELQTQFFLSQPAIRLCYSAEEIELFDKRAPRLIDDGQIRLCDEEELVSFHRPKLAFVMPNAARLITTRYLEASRRYFDSQNQLHAAHVDIDEIEIQHHRVYIPSLGLSGARIVFCGGHQDEQNPWLPRNVFNSAKGEVLTVNIEGYENPNTVHALKSWLCPTSNTSECSFGATYEHDDFECNTTARARQELEQRLRKIVRQPFTVEDQQFGVRPVGLQRKAIVGRHEQFRNVGWLNGLGSKGSLLAPYLASELVDSLLTDQTLTLELTQAHLSG